MKNLTLTDRLFSETADLKAEYLKMTAEFAVEDFKRISSITEEQVKQDRGYFQPYGTWSKQFKEGIEGRMCHTKASDAYWSKIVRIRIKGEEAYVSGMVKDAEKHYIGSIEKLAARIEAKDLNQETLTLSSSRVSLNFETVISDGKKRVRAFTIIASGAVQRPHYRYLIK